MRLSEDMKDLIELFERDGVQYALVGGYAVNFYGYVRSTQDIDLLVYPSAENAKKVTDALSEFGFGEAGIPKGFFETPSSAVHLGVEPNRIDLLTHLKGVENDQIFKNVKRVELESLTINIISLVDLVEVKRRSDRLKDQADAEELRKIQEQTKK
jgi:hypothetical protein